MQGVSAYGGYQSAPANFNLIHYIQENPLSIAYRVAWKAMPYWTQRRRAGTAGNSLDRRRVKVRDVVKLVEADGWREKRARGSHRQFKHPSKPGKVTIAGKPGADMPEQTLGSILKQAGLTRKDLR